MEEVSAKVALLHHRTEVSIRRGDDSYADRDFSVLPNAKHAVLLQHTQQLGLQCVIELADLIEQENPAFGGPEQSLAIVIRTGEGTTPMTEQFTLRQAGADRRTVERYERPCAPLGIKLVDGMGEEFLACPRLTGEQDRQVTERTDTKNRLKNSQ